ncbi:hypothetical protein M9Y10_035216 [Tritrichomonas musculus]|uniref:Small GTP-binding protein n=1 Tax=Tritrichomonas musculus TaxID=1915356 RepID=A0ABR2KH34_9EUKA
MNSQINNYKITLIGDSFVGKTMISNAIIDAPFSDDYVPSVGASMVRIQYNDKNTGAASCIRLWDTAGQEKYQSLASVFFQDSQAAIIVYDVSLKTSFQNVHKWHELYLDNVQTSNNKFLIVANKIDLREENTTDSQQNSKYISTEKGKECAYALNADFLEVSAKTGENINLIVKKMIEYAQSVNKKVTEPLQPVANEKKNCC